MKEHGNTKHGHARRSGRSPTWLSWASMIRRCTMPSQDNYHMYGGRGIKVCDRWRVFENFLSDMMEKPCDMTLDRIDSNGNYELENCRWATAKVQARNQRLIRRITHGGLTLTAAEWSDRIGIPSSAIRTRIDRLGWDIAKALTDPLVPSEVSGRRARAAQGPPAPIAEYVAALQQGESCAQIAKRYLITPSGVSKALLRAGIKASDYSQTTEARRERALNRLSKAVAVGRHK